MDKPRFSQGSQQEKCTMEKLTNNSTIHTKRRANYDKLGNAGIEGTSFQIDLLTVFLLSALEKFDEWWLSTENKEGSKFDDIVFESPDGDILLQAKYRQNEEDKISYEHLFSTNSKKCDFSLAKYFFAYQDIKSKFQIKNVVICTNAELKLDKDIIEVQNLPAEALLYFEGTDKICYTFKECILSKLKENAQTYSKKNLQNKNISPDVISDENILEYLRHLQLIANYPSGKHLEKKMERMISHLEEVQNLNTRICLEYIRKKMEDWFKEGKGKKGTYLTPTSARAFFYDIRSDCYCELLKSYNIFFQQDLSFVSHIKLGKGVLHVIPQENYMLSAIKVYQALQKENVTEVLYLNLDENNNEHKHIVESFVVPRYTNLVIISSNTIQENVAQEISDKILKILSVYKYKRIILIGGENDVLAKRIENAQCCVYNAVTDNTMFTNLTKEIRSEFRGKRIIFQDKDISLEELHVTDEDLSELLDANMLLEIAKKETVKVGSQLSNGNFDDYYVCRNFIRGDHSFSEEEICRLDDSYEEKIILISDSPGMGKSNVLTNLSIAIKNRHPHLWVVKIDLNRYMRNLWDCCNKNLTCVNILDLLEAQNETKFKNKFERKLFLMPKRVVLMVDGVDEIVPNYTDITLNLLKDCATALNFKKIFVTTRPHLCRKLEDILNVKCFSLKPFSNQDQVDFITKFWLKELKLQETLQKKRCKCYAETLVTAAASWIDEDSVGTFAGIPLQTRMLAEVFQEKNRFINESVDNWEGCIEFVNATNYKPRLPRKVNLVKLYQLFIDRKRDVFIREKGRPSGGIIAEEGVKKIFEECYAYHCFLALQAILDRSKCKLFRCYREMCKKSIEEKNLLKVGIVQKKDGQFCFIHRTFAEYFVAGLLLVELKSNFQQDFQKFLIEEILERFHFNIVRAFFNNFLERELPLIPENTYRNVKIKPKLNENKQPTDIFLHVIANEGCAGILHFLLKCFNFTNNRRWVYHIFKYITAPTDINVKGRFGQTALHKAAKSGHLDVVKLLTENNADVNIKDNDNYTAVDWAAREGYLEIVKFLMEKGSESKKWTDYNTIHQAAREGHLNVVQYLVESGMNIKDAPGGLALHFAAFSNHFHVVEYLLESGTDINIKGRHGCTALHYASIGGDLRMMKFLVEKGADINDQNIFGSTALHAACEGGNVDVVKFLVERGANINLKDMKGCTALYDASVKVISNVADGLLTVTAVDICSTICDPADNGPLDVFKFLIDKGAEVNVENECICKALNVAAQQGILDISPFLKDGL